MLGEVPNVSLFCSMFTLALVNKGNSGRTYALFGVDKEANGKFKSLLSKVCDWKVNFVMVQKWADIQLEEDTSTPWGFTPH